MKNLIQTVQIMRAMAAVLVVLVHSQYGALTAASSHFFSWGRMPEAGVDLFFVISGFIMMLVSDGREKTPGVFLLRRIQRIVPLYWFYTLLYAAVGVAVPSLLRWTTVTPELVITSVLFFPAAHPANGQVQPLLSVGWTLQFEMFFYLCFAAVLGLKIGARVAMITAFFSGLMTLTAITGREDPILWFLGNPLVLEFVAGMGVYWLWRRGWVTRRIAAPIALVALPALLWLVGSGAASPLEDAVDHRWIRPIAWGIPAVLLFYVGVAIREVPGAVGRALAHLGDASYSLYLVHIFVVQAMSRAWLALGNEPGLAFSILVILPCCIVAGLVSYRWIERPLGKMARGEWIRWFATLSPSSRRTSAPDQP